MTNVTDNDPADVLRSVERKQLLARERLQPGMIDVLVLLLAVTGAAGITGTYDTAVNRVIGIALTVVAAFFTSTLLRSRTRLGGRIALATWAIPATLFVVDIVLGFALHGTARNATIAGSAVVAAVVLGTALHSRWIVGLGAALLVVFVLGFAFASDVGSVGSFGFGIAFGLGAGILGRKRLRKR